LVVLQKPFVAQLFEGSWGEVENKKMGIIMNGHCNGNVTDYNLLFPLTNPRRQLTQKLTSPQNVFHHC
jgi:hypothetical protein